MSSLGTLPRELRHHILFLVFETAISADSRLNQLLERYIRSYYGHGRLELLSTLLPMYLYHALCAPPKRHTDERARQFAPSISYTATTLRATFPDLADDIDFVLSKSLDLFEEETRKAVDKIMDMHEAMDKFLYSKTPEVHWSDLETATEAWAREAEFQDQLADVGGISHAVDVDELTVEQIQKFGLGMILRFNSHVKLYRMCRLDWDGKEPMGR